MLQPQDKIIQNCLIFDFINLISVWIINPHFPIHSKYDNGPQSSSNQQFKDMQFEFSIIIQNKTGLILIEILFHVFQIWFKSYFIQSTTQFDQRDLRDQNRKAKSRIGQIENEVGKIEIQIISQSYQYYIAVLRSQKIKLGISQYNSFYLIKIITHYKVGSIRRNPSP
ncbi:unnamed protein product [Paramecium octaurelia]|uniref:Uncharacterized protein n=1 Tax=Paramecium octaurelia TaxID=43137 RepID=A0A8S1X4Y6_PAROT|nr:unnamed protein product [Paramecium octaurelia]